MNAHVLLLLAVICMLVMATGAFAAEKVIMDTDLGADCDDAGAFAVLHALADRGEVEILAIGIVNTHPNAVPAAHAINTWFGRPDVAIGTIKRETGFRHDRYLEGVVKDYPHTLTRETAPDAVKLYRRVLAAAEDRSITLITIGPATNISDLLDSGPDEISSLSGVELMEHKIKFYAAGGNGNARLPHGMAGWNYQQDPVAARNELAKLPVSFPTVFSGGSGWKVEMGDCYFRVREDHIVRRLYADYFKGKQKMDRPTWDPLRVLYGGRPAARAMWELSPAGNITVDGKVDIHWSAQPDRNRAYAYVKNLEAMRRELEPLMMHDPRQSR